MIRDKYKICITIGDLKKTIEELPDDLIFLGDVTGHLAVAVLDFSMDNGEDQEFSPMYLDEVERAKDMGQKPDFRCVRIEEATTDNGYYGCGKTVNGWYSD
jgi:hypothetical protein